MKVDKKQVGVGIVFLLFSMWMFYLGFTYEEDSFVGFILGGLSSLVGIGFVAMGFFEERIMKAMYGDFSNRNPWGR